MRIFSRCSAPQVHGLPFTRCILVAAVLVLIPFSPFSVHAGTVTFGSGTNEFTMDFSPIGQPGNLPDGIYERVGGGITGAPTHTTIYRVPAAGSVDYLYSIGTYEVSRDMITKYNADFGTANGLEISLQDMSAYNGNGPNKPATGLSWNESARFVNWLNMEAGGSPAYKFTTGGVNDNITMWSPSDTLDYDPSNPFRSRRARFAIPTRDEWHKAAFHDPLLQQTNFGWEGAGNYFWYPAGSSNPPTSVAGGTAVNTAVYANQAGPADVDNAGSYNQYGVMAMAGNASEWVESPAARIYADAGLTTIAITGGGQQRDLRGGWFNHSTTGGGGTFDPISDFHSLPPPPNVQIFHSGLRITDLSVIPEPSTALLLGLGLAGLASRRRR